MVTKTGMHAFHFTLFPYTTVYVRSEFMLTIPQVKRMSRVEELYQDTKERILGALKVPFWEEIPNYDGHIQGGREIEAGRMLRPGVH